MKKICIYSHKGGVGKTTLSYKLGIELAEMGKNVLLIDGDTQCNLSAKFLGGQCDIFYAYDGNTIYHGLLPVFRNRAIPLCPSPTVEHHDYPNLHLLPGHLKMSTLELSLSLAQETSGLTTLNNLPGSVQFLIKETAKSLDADYVIIDTSPAISAFNQNYWYSSNYFIIPVDNSLFSNMALEAMGEILPKWKKKGDSLAHRFFDEDDPYKFSYSQQAFLGFVSLGDDLSYYLPNPSSEKLIEELSKNNLLLSPLKYKDSFEENNFDLGNGNVLAGRVIKLTNT